METITAQSFADALTRCYENQRYKVGIAFSSTVSYIPFINELKDYRRTTYLPGVTDISITYNGGRILFANGSCIDLFIARESQRARRCNDLLYDESINADIIETVLRPMLVTYRNMKTEEATEDEDDNEELDDFLNSFTITP